MNASVLITGAGRGLGFALARAALAAGFRVVACERQRSSQLGELAQHYPERLLRVSLDVSSAESVRLASEQVTSELEGLDVLINNAAILPLPTQGTLDTLDVELGRQVLDVNALGPLRVTQAFLPLLKRGERKLVVNVSSEAGSIGDCWRSDNFPYCMSKAALNMQTALLANYLKPLGFRVFSLHPGWLRTDMGSPRADLEPDEAARALLTLINDKTDDGALFIDHTGKSLAF